MRRRGIVFALTLSAAVGWGVEVGRADLDANLARGFSPGQLYDYSGIDSVNLYNGVLGLRLPIGPRYPVGDQLSYGLTLWYSSNVWDPSYQIINGQTVPLMEPRRSSDAGLGWTISLGGNLYGPLHPSEAPLPSAGYQFESEDGAIHVFDHFLHKGENRPCAFTRDNTYLRLCSSGDEKTIEFPDGTMRTYTRLPTPPPSAKRPWDFDRYRLTRIEDPFDNWVNVAYADGADVSTWTITDSLGRSHTVSFHRELVDTENMWVVDFVKLKGFEGVESRYDFEHEIVEIARSCKYFEGTPSDPRFETPLLRAVMLPADESGFRMSYRMPDEPERPAEHVTAYNTECVDGLKDAPGTIKRLVLPAGGRLEWTYRNYLFSMPTQQEPDPVREIVEESTGVRTKTMLNKDLECDGGGSCTWTYNSISDSAENRKTVMTTPQGDDHVSYFRQRRPHSYLPEFTGWDLGLPFTTEETQAGLYLSQEIYDGSFSGGTLLRSVYVAYEHDELYYGGTMGIWSHLYTRSNRRVKAQRTLYHDDLNGGVPRFTAVDYDEFDGLGHYRKVVTTGNLGGSGAHTGVTDYNGVHNLGVYELQPGTNTPVPGYTPFPPYPHPWVIGTFESMRVEESGSAFASQYCFDPLTGRLERRRMQASASGPGLHDVIVMSTRAGGVLDPEEPPSATQPIVYEDFIYGGDLQGLDTGSDLCNIPLPATPVYRTRNTQTNGTLALTEPLNPDNGNPILRSLDLVIDSSTGLAKTSTDPAGLATDYEYDKLGRLLWIKPRAGGDAWTEIRYCASSTSDLTCPDLVGDPTIVTVRRRVNGSQNGSVVEETRTLFDPFGRVKRDDRMIPGHDWTGMRTTYNAMGWVTEVTERGAVGSDLPHKTRYLDYDPFGRPTRIQSPDYTASNDHEVTIEYLGVRWQQRGLSVATNLVGGETRYYTEEHRDHLGRLFRVRERNGAANAFNNTNYSYDAAGRLAGVTMHGGAIQQNRSFSYDGRGFLLSETHPENGTTYYSNYDAGGNAGRKRTGPQNGQFDLSYVYDDAQRLTKVRRWSDNQLLKEFTYGSGTTGSNRSKGKIETAVRHNHVLHPENGSQHDVIATETYTYGGRGGRPSLRTTDLSVGQNPSVKFSQSWGYNQLGQVNVLNYPACTHSGSTCSPGSNMRPRLVTFGHDLGYLTAVPGWADTISYHANGMLDEIDHANGMIYEQGLDPKWMRRPASLGVTFPNNLVAPEIFAVPLPYAYDGAGNVKSWYDWRYRYDPVSRVLEGAIDGGEAQSYTYDPFGNILTITTDLTGTPDPPPTTVQLGVVSSTNRLSASVYDDAGNLVSRDPFTYSYDPLSMMQTMAGPGTKNTHIYTADDERIWTVDSSDTPPLPWKETFTLRDLDGKVLRVFTTFDAFDFTNSTENLDDLAWSQDYIYRDGQLLATARVDGAGETQHHFHLNHLGTPLLITNSEGGAEELHSYYPFGEELFPDQDAEPMKFTGHERDLNRPGQVDDLDYMHARYYGTLMGRFLSADKAGVTQPRRPQSLNRYTYALNNPLVTVDPDGNIGVRCDACGATFDDPNKAMGDLPGRLRSETPHQRNVRHALTMPAAVMIGGSMAATAPGAAATLFPRATTVALTPGVQAAATGIAAGLADQPSPVAFSRALTAADLGRPASAFSELSGTFSVNEGTAVVRVDMIRGSVGNPFQAINSLVSLARENGATILRIEGTLANPRLLKLLQSRLGAKTVGAEEIIEMPVGP